MERLRGSTGSRAFPGREPSAGIPATDRLLCCLLAFALMGLLTALA